MLMQTEHRQQKQQQQHHHHRQQQQQLNWMQALKHAEKFVEMKLEESEREK